MLRIWQQWEDYFDKREAGEEEEKSEEEKEKEKEKEKDSDEEDDEEDDSDDSLANILKEDLLDFEIFDEEEINFFNSIME